MDAKNSALSIRSTIFRPLREVAAWHHRPSALERMNPSHLLLKNLHLHDTEIAFRLKKGVFWKQGSLHFQLASQDETSCILEDNFAEIPGIPLHLLEKWSSWRRSIIAGDLMLFQQYPSTPLKILLSGSSGLVGRSLTAFLRTAGHTVVRLVRDPRKRAQDTILWDPCHGEAQIEDFEGFDAVIHLAGENIANGRWSKKRKEKIFVSRCRDAWFLSQILIKLLHPPKVLISSSAVGFYGDRGDEPLTEESSAGKGFLADLACKWEAATRAVQDKGIRVVHPRFGPILSIEGGMLKKMLTPFLMGLGAVLGTGEQKVSWIALDDVIGSLYHILMKKELSGAVNITAPHPVSQKIFAEELGRALRCKAQLRIPAPLLKLLMGEMAEDLLLASTQAFPQKLQQTGYRFFYPRLEEALQHLLII